MDNLRIDGARLWDSIMAMAEIGPGVEGGSCRLALTDDDKVGRDLFLSWCRAAGCTVDIDSMGNLFWSPRRTWWSRSKMSPTDLRRMRSALWDHSWCPQAHATPFRARSPCPLTYAIPTMTYWPRWRHKFEARASESHERAESRSS